MGYRGRAFLSGEPRDDPASPASPASTPSHFDLKYFTGEGAISIQVDASVSCIIVLADPLRTANAFAISTTTCSRCSR
jgi:hypothetical protein